ncbi:uncharacterized protein LOC127762431 isoform X1 [Oryza glaberrima]|uniref:uncharacterized protein LOC127762431 isoform X1 n=1 Tax=Oryza glaberrima TaxID=4538 RepID=UPI00224C5ED0|nr:uncharacterized protein LOC127762431 isoform X1 [Oryza glaberrima]
MDGFASLIISSPSRLPPAADPALVASAAAAAGGSSDGGGGRGWIRRWRLLPPPLASFPRQIQRRWRRPRVDPAAVAAAGGGSDGSGSSRGGSGDCCSSLAWRPADASLPGVLAAPARSGDLFSSRTDPMVFPFPLARIRRSLRRDGWIRRPPPLPLGSCRLSAPCSRGSPPATTGVSRSGGVDPPCRRRFCTRGPYTAPCRLLLPQIREDVRTACVYVESLTKELVFTTKDVTQLLVKGLSNRRTGVTSANADSSRSHCVFTCVIKSESKVVLLIILSCTFNFYLVMSFFLRS